MPGPVTCLRVIALLLVATASSGAQDFHIGAEPTKRLFTESSFAHGYLHGYEQGYHYGDLDLQLSHPSRDVKKIKEYRNAKRNYEAGYGDVKSWEEGYRYGFRMGYADAYGGSEFRAMRSINELSKEIPDIAPGSAPILNDAITRGYLDGVKIGLSDGRANADYRPDGSDCDLALRFKAPPAKFFCNAYSLGYRFGYSDGFQNQRSHPVEQKIAGER